MTTLTIKIKFIRKNINLLIINKFKFILMKNELGKKTIYYFIANYKTDNKESLKFLIKNL